MADSQIELIFEHKRSQSQFAYFLLGLAASAIAFAVHETEGHSLSSTPWLIGGAVLLWALSFAAGCFGLEARQQAIATNVAFLRATRGIPENVDHPELRTFYQEVKTTTENDGRRPWVRFRIQLWSLFLGAMFYVGGHMIQMANLDRAKPMASQQVVSSSPTASRAAVKRPPTH